jgi:hypothetical protein
MQVVGNEWSGTTGGYIGGVDLSGSTITFTDNLVEDNHTSTTDRRRRRRVPVRNVGDDLEQRDVGTRPAATAAASS